MPERETAEEIRQSVSIEVSEARRGGAVRSWQLEDAKQRLLGASGGGHECCHQCPEAAAHAIFQ